MKKILALLIAALLCFSLIACASEAPEKEDEKKETKADDPTKKKGNKTSFKDEFTDYLSDYCELGVCDECGADCDDDKVFCDDCVGEMTNCSVCGEELKASDYVIHEDCFDELKQMFEESYNEDAYDDEEYVDDEAEYVDDEAEYVDDEAEYVDDEAEEDVCFDCGGPLGGNYMYCDDCLVDYEEEEAEDGVCAECGGPLGGNYMYCDDCLFDYSEEATVDAETGLECEVCGDAILAGFYCTDCVENGDATCYACGGTLEPGNYIYCDSCLSGN